MNALVGQTVLGTVETVKFEDLVNLEYQRIQRAVEIERVWWKEKVIDDEASALRQGILIEVPDEGEHYRLESKLRRKEEPKSLLPGAYHLLNEIARFWETQMILEELPVYETWFSVCSLYRSKDLQQVLISRNPHASNGISAHGAGAAIDIHPNGYYSGTSRTSVNPDHQYFDYANSRVMRQVLETMESRGYCHVIYEIGHEITENVVISYDYCYHVCASPSYVAKWQ